MVLTYNKELEKGHIFWRFSIKVEEEEHGEEEEQCKDEEEKEEKRKRGTS